MNLETRDMLLLKFGCKKAAVPILGALSLLLTLGSLGLWEASWPIGRTLGQPKGRNEDLQEQLGRA